MVVFDPATMHEEVLLKDVPEGYFVWSPAEDYLIYSPDDKGEAVSGPLKRLLHPDDRIPDARSRNYLVKYDPATGLSERLTYGSHAVYLNDISSDGKKLLCSTSKSDITQCPFSLTSIFEVDLATLRVDTLVAWDPYVNRGAYSPDGKRLLVVGSPSAFGGVGKNCGEHPIANDFDTQAFIVDKATKKVTPITRDFNPSVDFLQWNRTDGCIYFNTTDEDCKHIYRYIPQTDSFEMLPLQEDVIASFDLAENNPTVAAYVGGGNTSVGVAYAYDVKKKTSALLANPMKPVLDKIEMGTMKEWNFTSEDGTEIKGMMCLPPAFDPNKNIRLSYIITVELCLLRAASPRPTVRSCLHHVTMWFMSSSPAALSVTVRSSPPAMLMRGANVLPMKSLKERRSSVRLIRLLTISVLVVLERPMAAL